MARCSAWNKIEYSCVGNRSACAGFGSTATTRLNLKIPHAGTMLLTVACKTDSIVSPFQIKSQSSRGGSIGTTCPRSPIKGVGRLSAKAIPDHTVQSDDRDTFNSRLSIGQTALDELQREGFGKSGTPNDSHGRSLGWGIFDHVSELLGVPIDSRLVVVLVAVTIAGLLRGFVGFGAALISVPVFSLVLGPHAAIAVNNVMGLPAVFQLLPEAIRRAERPVVLPICAATFLATPIGTWALVATDPALMTVAISALVLLMVAILASGWRLRGRIGMGKLIAAGVAGGLVQGAAGVGGPPVVAVALSRPGDASQQRANVLALMTAVSLSSVLPLLYYGLFTWQTVVIGLMLIPFYSAATAIGARYFALGGQRHYRRAALATLAAIGIATLIASLRAYLKG